MPTVLLTICTIRQLPQAIALGNSFRQFSPQATPESVLIGLADDPTQLPAGFDVPYPILPIRDLLPAEALARLSSSYTPTEFAAACKPLFIREALRRYPAVNRFLYADPAILFFASLDPIWTELAGANLLLTPFITRKPTATESTKDAWPDEKFFQNTGLYSADFLAFSRSVETERMLGWWDDRVRERAYIDFCAGLCLDQLWLMHVPIFFRDVRVVKNPGWHVGLWNLPERHLHNEGGSWTVDGPGGQSQPLQFMNFKGLANPDEGFFPHQNRLRLADRPDAAALVQRYRQSVITPPTLAAIRPAYGHQSEPKVIRGWRYHLLQSARVINRFLDRVYLPAIR